MATWALEGIQCYVATNPIADHVPLYRAWNGKDHFYTANQLEYDGLPYKWQREGVACYVASSQLVGHVPLYRLYRGKVADHLYTTSLIEKNLWLDQGSCSDEGIAGYVKESIGPRRSPLDLGKKLEKAGKDLKIIVPIPLNPAKNLRISGYVQDIVDTDHFPFYRAYNPGISDHFYTTSMNEIEAVVPKIGYKKLTNFLKEQLESYLQDECKIYLSDPAYHTPQESVAQMIVNDENIDQMTYISEKFDCDDFAHLLKSAFIMNSYTNGLRRYPYAFGITWGKKPEIHAMNFVITSNGSNQYILKFVEPQTGVISAPAKNLLSDIYLIVV